MLERILSLRAKVREQKPLIHCMTGAVSSNDCANVVLAAGARPIMAEHPDEVREITTGADALALNLAGITDRRMEAMLLSAEEAGGRGIPIIIDLAGVGCSSLRLSYAGDLIKRFRPDVIKGNLAEITALREGRTVARGVDARDADLLADSRRLAREAVRMAEDWGAVILISGPVDIVATAKRALACANGHPMLGELTGTGCMLNVLAGAFCAVGPAADGAAMAVLLEGVAGELAAASSGGIGSFKPEFFDAVYNVTDEELRHFAKLEEMTR